MDCTVKYYLMIAFCFKQEEEEVSYPKIVSQSYIRTIAPSNKNMDLNNV